MSFSSSPVFLFLAPLSLPAPAPTLLVVRDKSPSEIKLFSSNWDSILGRVSLSSPHHPCRLSARRPQPITASPN
ncbi:hypothetical protein E2C01_077423 [Portunus trituberculatus]|uniref:Secreted protein n=1 Tax=Portunus trituberculatus TaxID=210409 RepID=A0A5B7IBE7_PORTR|nr:hypothetical protein [Portunus trituberculatus]